MYNGQDFNEQIFTNKVFFVQSLIVNILNKFAQQINSDEGFLDWGAIKTCTETAKFTPRTINN